MAESNINVTPGIGGPNVDLEIIDNGNARQVVCIGDPTLAARVASVDASGNFGVNVQNFPATQNVSVVSPAQTSIMKTGTLVTTAVTADQVVLTYTVTAGKTFWLAYLKMDTALTVISATAAILGTHSFESPAGTKLFTLRSVNPTTSETGSEGPSLGASLSFPAGTVLRVVCTPAAATSTTWVANFGGYEI